jgi:ATP-binding cassette, subfamily B (MDR/TAP), member 1
MSSPASTGGNPPTMSVRGMFRFADRVDVLLMVLGTLGAIGDGCSTNLLLIFASDVMNALGYGRAAQQGAGGAGSVQFMHEVEKVRFLHRTRAFHALSRGACVCVLTTFITFLFFPDAQSCMNFVYLAFAVLAVAFMGKFFS